ncbi:MAG: hypothetical protein JNG90_18180, partial [Planctomycetaceae bacterium]|nr:hypothetical protein [Planctomycetaceae bacterium]
TFGANFAEDTKQIKAQAIVKPTAGSGLATHFAELGTEKTRFGGIFASPDKATLLLGMTGKLAAETAGDLKSELEAYRALTASLFDTSPDVAEGDRQLFKDLGGAIVDSLQATFAERRLDFAVKIIPGNPSSLVGALHITNGGAITAQLDKLIEATKDDPNSGFKVDEAVHNSVRIHSVALPTDSEFTALMKPFGGSGRFYLAVNDNTLYFAFGAKSVDFIKQAIEAPELADVAPLRVTGKAAGLFRMLPPPLGGGNLQLLTSVIALQLQVGDGFTVVGQTPEGSLVIDMTFDKGFLRLGAFMIPTVGNLLLPSIDLNNLGGTFGF